MPDGPARLEAIDRAKRLLIAYMPYKAHAHRIATDLMHPWLVGNHTAPFRPLLWKYVDIDTAERERRDRP